MEFSVVIPTHNRSSSLRRVLAAYEAQQPRDLTFEVVAVDDGSGDGTAEVLAGWRPRRYRLRFAVEPAGGPARARNRALELAAGRRVLFTGDDIEPAPDLLHQHLLGHQQYQDPGVAILGFIGWPEGSRPTATMRHVDGPGAQQFSYYYFADGAEYDFRHLYTSNVSVSRRLLDREPSYFSTDFPAAAFEDAEFGYRLARRGLRIFYRAAARASHHHRYEAAGFFHRQVRCGEMAALFYRKSPELERFLDLATLENRRLVLLTHPGGVPECESLHLPLAEAERRMLHLAGFFDPLPFDVDELLGPLFRYAYLRGFAASFYPPATAERLCARLFADILFPALERFAPRLRQESIPYPQADLDTLCPRQGDILRNRR
ncbi:MAG: glycosyltransferase [Thermoanaerobaculia bacterium]